MELYYTIFSFLLFSVVFERCSTKAKHYVLFMWGVFFTLFGGLRWEIGGDWAQYHDHFLNSNWSNIFNYDRYGNGMDTLEPLFVFLNALVKSIFGTFYWYNILCCAFIQYTYIYACKYYSPSRPLIMYIFIMLMGGSYFPVRAGLSIAICVWAYQMIKEKRLKAFLLIMFLAFNIHHASIIFLPAYWLGKIKLKPINIYGILLIFAVAGYVFQDFFTALSAMLGGDMGEKALFYTMNQTENYDDAKLSIVAESLTFLFLWGYIKVRSLTRNQQEEYWINTLVNCFFIYNAIAYVFIYGMGDLTRLASYYFFAHAILFVTLLSRLKHYGKLFSILGYTFFILYMGWQVTKIGNGFYFKAANIPYKTIFDYGNTK